MEALNEHCGVERDRRGVARLVIRNAGSLNILGTEEMKAVRGGIEALAAEAALRAIVLAGESERAFVGGADIKEMAGLTPDTAEAFITCLAGLCEAVRLCPVPAIACIRGWCLGGGLELAAACDLRIASVDAKFGMPEVRIGIPLVIHAALLPRLVGWGRASRLLLTGATIGAAEALAWGLVDQTAAPGRLDAALAETLEHILSCDPSAVRAQKALLRQWEALPLAESITASIAAFRQVFIDGNPQRLMRAFLDRKRSG